MPRYPIQRSCENDVKVRWRRFFETAPGQIRLIVVTTGVHALELYNQYVQATQNFPGQVSTTMFSASECPKIIKPYKLHSLPAVLVFRGKKLIEKWTGLSYKKDNVQKATGRLSVILGSAPRMPATRPMLPVIRPQPVRYPAMQPPSPPTRPTPSFPAAQIGPRGYNISETPQEKAATERWLSIINNERRRNGLQPLRRNAVLDKTAKFMAVDMATRHFYAHVNPDRQDVAARVAMISNQTGLPAVQWRAIGENIDKDEYTPEQVHASLMRSPHHRENIVRPNFTHVGLAFHAPSRHWVQVFTQGA